MSESESLPLISICLIVKNGAKTLEECLRRIVLQEYPRIELIVQDCVSTDGTLEILEKYASRIPMDVVSEPDSGHGDGIDRALRRVKGEIVGFMAADERFWPGAFQWAVKAFQDHPEAGAVYGDCRAVYSDWQQHTIWYSKPMTYATLLCLEHTPMTGCTFVLASRFRDVGLHGDPNLKYCPDFEMWTRIGLRYPFQYVPGVIADFMIHPGERANSPESMPATVAGLIGIITRITRNPETPPRIRALERRAIAGAYAWAGLMSGAHRWYSLRWYLRAFLKQPSLSRLWMAIRLIPMLGLIEISTSGPELKLTVRLPGAVYNAVRRFTTGGRPGTSARWL